MKSTLSTPLAQGRTAEIFLWDTDLVLKLYRDWCPPDWVEYEARIAHAVHAAGVPSPAAGEIVEANGRRGLIYERIEGTSILQEMNARPWTLLNHARSLAELQVEINQKSIPGLPTYKDRLHYDISNTQHLEAGLQEKVLALLETLPERPNLCHGDYHPGNIMLTQKGPVVIDWMTACSGSPWADVARTSLLLTIGPKAAGKLVSPIIRMVIKLYHRAYLNRYHALVPNTEKEANHWMPVIAAARLNEEILPEQEALIKMIKEG